MIFLKKKDFLHRFREAVSVSVSGRNGLEVLKKNLLNYNKLNVFSEFEILLLNA